MTPEAKEQLKQIRQEMKKEHPDGEKIFELLCGTKYNKPLIKKK